MRTNFKNLECFKNFFEAELSSHPLQLVLRRAVTVIEQTENWGKF